MTVESIKSQAAVVAAVNAPDAAVIGELAVPRGAFPHYRRAGDLVFV